MSVKQKIVCFGPGPRFKGGIQNYNTSLALALDAAGCDVTIVSWTQQYPAIIPREFVDKSSQTDLLEGSGVKVVYLTNYNNPLSWRETVKHIKALQPDKVIFQWSIALQGLPIGYIVKRLARTNAEIIMDLHFVIQKENASLDKWLTRMGIRHASTYIVHALKTYQELTVLFPKAHFSVTESGVRKGGTKNVIKLFHPIYDLFKPDPNFDTEAFKRSLGLRKHVFLFFGFIRKYKGLHNAIEAFAELAAQRDDVSFLICGESFWHTLNKDSWSTKLKQTIFNAAKSIFLKKQDDERSYHPLEMIKALGIEDRCVVFNRFIPNEEVHRYFQVADAAVLFYLTATPSGIESLSYNFKLPLLATAVGHFPETIQNGFNGYLARPDDIHDMAHQMRYFLEHPIDRANVEHATKNMSWANYAAAILNTNK